MSDLISRRAAIQAIHDEFDECLVWDESGECTANEVERVLEELPPIEPTLYGYNVQHLALIAAVMAKENVTPEKAVETFRNIVGIVQMIIDEQKEIIQKTVEQWKI